MIVFPERFKQAFPAGFDGVFDWDFLEPAFGGTKIMPMDIDAVVERKGRILLFETKADSKQIPVGQRITLETFLKIGKGLITVFIVYGKTPETITGLEEWHFSTKKNSVMKKDFVSCDSDYVMKRVTKWFKWADRQEEGI
jgi:hypothetical protein